MSVCLASGVVRNFTHGKIWRTYVWYDKMQMQIEIILYCVLKY